MIKYLALLSTLAAAMTLEQEEEEFEPLYPEGYDISNIDPWLPNMQPDLKPPNGKIWRGATIDKDVSRNPDYFEDFYGVPL